MTDTDRERIIALMVDNPEQLSDADIKTITTDSELREIYEIARNLRHAADEPANIDAEWQLFNAKLAEHHRPKFHWRRIAATVAITLTISATAAILIAPDIFIPAHRTSQTVEKQNELTTEPISTTSSTEVQEFLPAEREVFDNVSLAEIMNRIAEIYNCKVEIAPNINGELRLYFSIEAGQTLESTIKMLDAFEALEVTLIDDTIIVK